MDTSSLLLLFLAFGAACSSLWAWRLAQSASSRQWWQQRPQPAQ